MSHALSRCRFGVTKVLIRKQTSYTDLRWHQGAASPRSDSSKTPPPSARCLAPRCPRSGATQGADHPSSPSSGGKGEQQHKNKPSLLIRILDVGVRPWYPRAQQNTKVESSSFERRQGSRSRSSANGSCGGVLSLLQNLMPTPSELRAGQRGGAGYHHCYSDAWHYDDSCPYNGRY